MYIEYDTFSGGFDQKSSPRQRPPPFLALSTWHFRRHAVAFSTWHRRRHAAAFSTWDPLSYFRSRFHSHTGTFGIFFLYAEGLWKNRCLCAGVASGREVLLRVDGMPWHFRRHAVAFSTWHRRIGIFAVAFSTACRGIFDVARARAHAVASAAMTCRNSTDRVSLIFCK